MQVGDIDEGLQLLQVRGDERVTPGPIVLFMNHASVIDTLLPVELVCRRHGMRLRYVLKKELLVDPCLDIVGLRVPNHFLDREAADGSLELMLTHPTGFVEIYLGRADGAKIELQTDVVARTETAKEYAAGHRLYGLVDGKLLWAYDMAAMGHDLQPHLSATLNRV